MNAYKPLHGLIAAVFTPFKEDGEINPAVVGQYAARLKQQGISGVFVNGSSGEGMMLSVEERKAMAEAWMPFREENFRIIIHVGSVSIIKT